MAGGAGGSREAPEDVGEGEDGASLCQAWDNLSNTIQQWLAIFIYDINNS